MTLVLLDLAIVTADRRDTTFLACTVSIFTRAWQQRKARRRAYIGGFILSIAVSER